MLSLALTVIGLALNLLVGLMSAEWRAMHRKIVYAGHMFGFVLLGLGLYMLVLVAIPPHWTLTMLPKISMVVGAVLLVGGAIWQFVPAMAQTSSDNSVTGMTVEGNGQGSAAADVSVTGSTNQSVPPVGLDVNAVGAPGQSVTGLKIIQRGPGTGLKITVGGDGSATGARVTVGAPPKQ